MLYVIHADGREEAVSDAVNARIEETTGELICLNEKGEEVCRYAHLAIILYSQKPPTTWLSAIPSDT